MTAAGSPDSGRRSFVPVLLVVLLAAAIDMLARFRGAFDMGRVLRVEAVLFPMTGLVLLFLLWRRPPLPGFRRRLQIVLAAGFLLAGLRSGLWAWGMPVGRVNLVVLGAAAVAWVVYRVRVRQG
jgi:hypothetical protein